MSEIKPKKERRFLKTLGRVGEILVEQVLLKLGSSIIRKIGGKKTLPSILFLLASLSLLAQYPNTGNKQRLGFQTTGDGLTWRGSISDTAYIQPINNQNAWVILDTINLKFYSFDFTSNVWNLVGGAPGLTMPFDSITFNTAKDGTVGVGEVEYNDTQGSLIQGLKGGLVTNVIGQQLHQRVNNRTGATLTKGTAVYLSGSQGNRITVAKALGVTDAFSANTFGIVAENILNNQSGYVITEGLITGLNTSALTEDSAVYLSPTVAGGLTSTKPQAPQHTVYIGVCVKSNAGSGELFVKIRNGQELDELHDVRITSPADKASLYYSGGLWRDTTAALLVSDTASMLTNYLRTGTAASTYLPLTGGTLSINSSTNYVASANDNANLTLYNSSSNGTNTIYNGLKFFVGAAGGAITGGEGQANIYAIRRGSNLPGTDLSFILKGAGVNENEMLERLRLKYDGKVGIGTSTPNYLLDVNGTLGVTGATTLTGGINGNIKTNGAAGATATPDNIWLGNSFSNGTTRDKLKIYLYNDGTEKYGFGVGSIGDIQYHSNTTHDFYIANTKKFFISNTNTTTNNIFTVNNAAVFNEAAADADFRVESVGNLNMVFVDASTDRVGIGYASPTKTLDVNGELRIGTISAPPTALLGKDGSNVVGEVTTVAQTGLMTRGLVNNASTITGSELIEVTHNLGSNPTSVLVTVFGSTSYILQVSSKASNIFTVQVKNYDGTAAIDATLVSFSWLAIK